MTFFVGLFLGVALAVAMLGFHRANNQSTTSLRPRSNRH